MCMINERKRNLFLGLKLSHKESFSKSFDLYDGRRHTKQETVHWKKYIEKMIA